MPTHFLLLVLRLTLYLPFFFFLMIRRPPRSTLSSSSAASDVYKRQGINAEYGEGGGPMNMSTISQANLSSPETSSSSSPNIVPSKTLKSCRCRKTTCLKLYCDCFAAGQRCTAKCQCIRCKNTEQDPMPEIDHMHYDAKLLEEKPGIIVRGPRGCGCRRSGCRKKYCDCFNAAEPCTEACGCVDCVNDGTLDIRRSPRRHDWAMKATEATRSAIGVQSVLILSGPTKENSEPREPIPVRTPCLPPTPRVNFGIPYTSRDMMHPPLKRPRPCFIQADHQMPAGPIEFASTLIGSPHHKMLAEHLHSAPVDREASVKRLRCGTQMMERSQPGLSLDLLISAANL
eukprot:TRINITY_DN3324_c0_g1_i1.p1 TRINITY_DN3324_c0_g1~~TRINITY_DN3324_c0_g1_i1.p1  ORF type:complete len:343 (+),score=22.60 TRINITY_DN3324_c0_g1_i1:54-1082(+)